VAFLYLVRCGGERLSLASGRLPRGSRSRARDLGVALLAALQLAGCQAEPEPDTRPRPDSLLQAELGLTIEDEVHRVLLSGGYMERADPAVTSIERGAYVEFVTTDWLIHEIVFDVDSLSAEQLAFLQRTDQVASPPLVDRASRYVLVFAAAPLGRYPYTLEGNGRSGGGVIVVTAPAEASAPR
jgi:hypothetical protein